MKFFVAIFALVFAVNVFAVDPNEANAHKNLGDWDTGPSGFGDASDYFGEDYSYDQCFTHYEAFVICPIECHCYDRDRNFGYINPDGVKNVMDNQIQYLVSGGTGWPFEFKLTLGDYNNGVWFPNQAWSKTTNPNAKDIYLTDVELTFGQGAHTAFINNNGMFVGRAKLSGHMKGFVKGDYDADGNLIGADNWTIYKDDCCDDYNVPCKGKMDFTLTPGYLWAEPDASEAIYSWDVLFEVDYLTFISSNGFPIAGDQGK